MNFKFFKLYVAGRDYILADFSRDSSGVPKDYPSLAQVILHRRRGVGGGGFCALERSQEGKFRVRQWDRGGMESHHPRDAFLCAARYLFDSGMAVSRKVEISGIDGNRKVEAVDSTSLKMDLGVPLGGFPRPEDDSGSSEADEGNSRVVIDTGKGIVYARALTLGTSFFCSSREEADGNAMERIALAADAQQSGNFVPVASRIVSLDEIWAASPSRYGADSVSIAACALVASRLDGLSEGASAVRLGDDYVMACWEGPGSQVSASAEPEYTFEGEYFFQDAGI